MANRKYLKLYNKWMKSGKLSNDGLCNSIPNSWMDPLFRLFIPNHPSVLFWAYIGNDEYDEEYRAHPSERRISFTPLRQNIILLISAMNNEL